MPTDDAANPAPAGHKHVMGTNGFCVVCMESPGMAANPAPAGLRKRVVANFRARVVKAKGTQQALDYSQLLDWAWDEETANPAPADRGK